MSEVPQFDYSSERVNEISRELLGAYRVNAPAAFSSEAYLQRKLDEFMRRPGAIAVTYSYIDGGDEIVEHNRLRQVLIADEKAPDSAPRASALHSFFCLGFGAVEEIMVSNSVLQAPHQEAFERYCAWHKAHSLPDRTADMRAYLEAQDAQLLALNLLGADQQGTILNSLTGLFVTIPRVTGREPYRLHAHKDREARSQITEGVLAALFLLREHYVAQYMDDVENAYYDDAEDDDTVPEDVSDAGVAPQNPEDLDWPPTGNFVD